MRTAHKFPSAYVSELLLNDGNICWADPGDGITMFEFFVGRSIYDTATRENWREEMRIARLQIASVCYLEGRRLFLHAE